MEQSNLWHDTIYDALGATIIAAGGAKKVAARLWPAIDTSSATSRLRGCLSPEHAQKLCPEELILIGRLGREAGDDSLMNYLARELGYEVKPLTPVDAKRKAKKARTAALLSELAKLMSDE